MFVRVFNTLPRAFLQKRTEVISTYALCGFANFGSIGIILGGLGVMAPHRKSDMAKVVLRAMIAGNVACFMTACIAGKCALLTIYLLNKKQNCDGEQGNNILCVMLSSQILRQAALSSSRARSRCC